MGESRVAYLRPEQDVFVQQQLANDPDVVSHLLHQQYQE